MSGYQPGSYQQHNSSNRNSVTMGDSSPASYIQYSGQKRPASSSPSSRGANPGPNRSVNDFESEDQLRDALLSFDTFLEDPDCRDVLRGIADGEPVQKAARVGEHNPAGEQVVQHLDWVLPNFDAATTEAQSMDQELRRLQVLRRYLILDSDREEAFERITSLASRIFDVPIALVSLVDVGRQWFMSNHGLGDVRETPRKMAFCSRKSDSSSYCYISRCYFTSSRFPPETIFAVFVVGF